MQLSFHTATRRGPSGGRRNTSSAGAHFCVTGNVVDDVDEHGIFSAANGQVICGNTVIGNGTASQFGIRGTNNAEFLVTISNILKGWSGTSGGGYDILSGGNQLATGYNHFHDNTTDEANKDTMLDLGNDQTTDPTFTDDVNQDWSVGTNAKAKGWPTGVIGSSDGANTGTLAYVDTGAVQREEPAGGGGDPTGKQGLHPIESGSA